MHTWIMSSGAMVVMVPCPMGETAKGDVTLAHYAEWLGGRVRDLYDLAVVEAFSQAGKPIFGVCRGLQLINVAFGGTLYQDILTQVPGAQMHRNADTYDRHQHDIHIVKGTRLAELFPNTYMARVNSIHHQGIKDVAPGFEVEAWSVPDHIPEAIYRNTPKKVISRQPNGTPNFTRQTVPSSTAACCWAIF